MKQSRIVTSLIGVALLAAGLMGCASSPTPQAFTCVSYQAKPASFTPYCADAGQNYDHIKWNNWEDSKAEGTASVSTNLCDPNCAAGKINHTTAQITLTKPVKVGDKMVFSALEVRYQKPVPGHPAVEKLDLTTKPFGQ